MRLTLQNGYPCPLPPGFDFDAHNPHMHFVEFDGVRHFEWLHTLTIGTDTGTPLMIGLAAVSAALVAAAAVCRMTAGRGPVGNNPRPERRSARQGTRPRHTE